MTRAATSIVDTDVFSVLYLRSGSSDPRASERREQVAGRRVVISFQTRAEALAGARTAGWGERRIAETVKILNDTPTIYPDKDVVDAYATLVGACRRSGHALHDSKHTGDRGIAACAIAKRVDLLAGDSIYRDTPNLTLANRGKGTHG